MNMLGWMVDEKVIAPHVPLFEKGERRDGTFGRSDFVFDADADSYTCPGGKLLLRYRRKFKKRRTGVTKANTTDKKHNRYAIRQQCADGRAEKINAR